MCLAVTENIIFRKMISGWPLISPLTRKWISPLIFTSKDFRKKRERERERERESARERERERERVREREREIAPDRDRDVDRDRLWFFFGLWLVSFWICVFLLLFQTPENIFRKIFWNATKHREIFSFWKYVFSGKRFTATNHHHHHNNNTNHHHLFLLLMRGCNSKY